jgi:O-antigen ligase
MTRGRYAAFVVLLVMFYFAQDDYWASSLRYASSGGIGIPSTGEMIHTIETGSWRRELGVLSIGVFGALVLMRNRRRNLRVRGLMGVAILFFFWWALASLAWADDRDLAARRVICFGILWFAAFALGCNYKQREVLHFLLLASLAFIGLGLAAELALGTLAPADPLYRFCGTLQPNHQAWNCAGLALSGIALGSTQRHHRFLFFSATALGIAALVLTKSRTSAGAFLAAIVFYKALVSTRRQRMFWMALVPVLLCALVPSLVLDRAELASVSEKVVLLGRGAEEAETLTGRTTLWRSGLSYFYDHPLRGYGFNAFETPHRIVELERKAGWAAGTFHSEYFDLLLGVGCIGAITYVFIILCGLRRTLLLYKLHRSKYYAMECAIVVFFLALMLLENPGRDPNVPTFIFFTILAKRGLSREAELQSPIRSPVGGRRGRLPLGPALGRV